MQISAETFWVQKAGNDQAEYEDAFWPRDRLIGECGQMFKFAVADGATDSCFSGTWARQLVRAYCEGLLEASDFENSLAGLQQRWWQEVASKGPLPWYVEERVESGAFATLLGLTLEGSTETATQGTWRALAIGDSCLFHLRERQVLQSFPLEHEDCFNNSPALLSSKSDRNATAFSSLRTIEREWRAGDSFYLTTDALAWWVMKQLKDRRVPWKLLVNMDERNKRFRPWIDRLRISRRIRNDDVTLVRIAVHPSWDS